MTAAQRGRPPKTTGQFINVSRETGSVYLAGMSNGMVKVGVSNNPRTRLEALSRECSRRFGGRVVQFHVYDGIGAVASIPSARQTASSRARAIESRCINLLSAVGRQRPPTLEYFEGIDYCAAKALVDSEISSLVKGAA